MPGQRSSKPSKSPKRDKSETWSQARGGQEEAKRRAQPKVTQVVVLAQEKGITARLQALAGNNVLLSCPQMVTNVSDLDEPLGTVCANSALSSSPLHLL